MGLTTHNFRTANDHDSFPEASAVKERFLASRYERLVLEGVGHFIPCEAPGEVLSAIRALLSEPPSRMTAR
jgi:pimeloyl-ACP methyl ester carboxylesterase